MKKLFILLSICFLALTSAKAATITITGDIESNKTWTRANVYILAPGFHYVIGNSTLTIQSGTLIKGDNGTLVITKGSKIVAAGTETQPIVFTSSKPAGERAAGDWGGIVICGKAPINVPGGSNIVEGGLDVLFASYGGTNAADNSGVLQYVRIEYAGKYYQANNELNSLTLAGVGTGTVIDHVQCMRGLDDAFEWFGGTVNAKYLVASYGLDDEFDTDFGYSGSVQFAVGLRDPNAADISGSNGFESDNDATGSTNAPFTNGQFSNVTLIGPIQGTGNTFNANFKRGAHLRRSTKQDIYNSVFVGYPVGLRVENTNTGNFANTGDLNFKNNIIAGCTTPLEAASTTGFDIAVWYAANSNTTYTNVSDAGYTNPYIATAPNFKAVAGSNVLTGANFTGLSSFFTATTYRGAFSTSAPWTACWCEFDPQTQPYTAQTNYLAGTITPSASSVTVGTTLTAQAGTGFTYRWQKNGVNLTGSAAFAQTYTPTSAGAYRCKISTPRGCSKFTASKTVTVAMLGTDTEVANTDILTDRITALQVYPNPASGQDVQLSFEVNTSETTVQIQLFDLMGRQVVSQSINAEEGVNAFNFTTANLAKGVYIVRVINGGERFDQKLIVE